MKRRIVYLLLGALAVSLVSGCGSDKDDTGKDDQQIIIEVTPTLAAQDGELVNMQKITGTPAASKVLGTKTSTASSLTIVNSTGREIVELYIRSHVEDYSTDNWGEDLMKEAFTLKNGESAVYYYEAGSSGSTYDIRIVYETGTDDENYFRDLNFRNMKEIKLVLTDDSIPYATYYDESTKKNSSTLQEVKVRMGLLDASELQNGTSGSGSTTQQNTDKEEGNQNTQQPNATPTPEPSNGGEGEGGTQVPPDTTSVREKAQTYIGSGIGDLMNDPDIGGANSSNYETDPDLGEVGYYYYDNFTVSTSVDENGNEVVTNIW